MKAMPRDCGSCGGCHSDCKAPEYINPAGYSAVKCPTCETEIVFDRSAGPKKISCEECGTVIEIVPVLLN